MDHSNAVEADLARYYPRTEDQLPAFYTGDMSLRRLWVLISGLPQDSNTSRAIDGEASMWTPDTYLLARIANLILVSNYKDTKKKPPKAEFIKGPGQAVDQLREKKEDKQLTQAEFDGLFTGG